MKHIYRTCCLLVALSLFCHTARAQCSITVDAGEDITLCDPFTPVQLNGSVDGPYIKSFWSPASFFVNPNDLGATVNVTQTTTFVLRARTNELGANLVYNPDFELGNVGFFSDLEYGSLYHPNAYDIVNNPQTSNDAFFECRDHTTGDGNMLAAHITQTTPAPALWCQTVPVEPNTDYYFSYWANRLSPGIKTGVRFWISGQNVSSLFFFGNTPQCEWKNANGIWNSGDNTYAHLCIYNYKTAHNVAIDDIFFAPFCYTTDSLTVSVKSVKAVAAPSLNDLPCGGFEITLDGTGSSVGPEYTYEWGTNNGNIVSGHNTLHPVVNEPGTYTLTVTLVDGLGDCIKTAVTEVEVLSALQAGINAPISLNCFNANAVLQGFSSQPANSTYQWSASQGGHFVSGTTSPVAVIDQPGEYTLLVTNTQTGCTAENTVLVGPAVKPVANATAGPITCAAPETVLSGAGSSAGNNITYSWTTSDGNITSGANNQNATANAAGTYIFTVKNVTNNCVSKDTVTVSVNNTAVAVDILPADKITCLQNSITLATTNTGGSHHAYAWTALPGANIVSGENTLNPVVNAPGLYVLQVTDTLNACTGIDTVAVDADNDAIVAIANTPGDITCITKVLTLDSEGSSNLPGLTYAWTTSDGHFSGATDVPNPAVDAPGTYTLLLTNPASGCTATDLVVVVENTEAPEIEFQPYTPLSCAQPLLTLIGTNNSPTGAYTYEWTASDGGHIFSGDGTLMLCVDAAGTYTLLVTNESNGCTDTRVFPVGADFDAPELDLSVSGPINCHAPAVTLLNTSGTTPGLLDHNWTLPDGSEVNTGTTPSFSTGTPGEYTLLLSNIQNGCTATTSLVVVQHEAVVIETVSQQNIPCFGDENGAIGITAAGGDGNLSYLWSNDKTTAAIEGLAAGTYTVTVTDGENCTTSQTFLLGQPAELLAGASATPPSSAGASDGTATANPQGGTLPYSYAWDNGKTTQTIEDLPAGFYTVTVTDGNGCTAVQTVEVWGGLCNIQAQIQGVDPLCHGATNGTATIMPTGGAEPYSYNWTSGSNQQTATGLAAGTYGVTLTDANGCDFASSVTLAEPAALTLEVVNVVNTVCANSADGQVSVLVEGGTGTTNVSWSNGQQGEHATGLPAGEHFATVTDANGCTAVTSATVIAIDLVPPVLNSSINTLALGPSGSIELNIQNLGISASDNCKLEAVEIVPDEFDCFDLGEQQVTVTAYDASGNSTTKNLTINFVDTEIPVLQCPASITRCAGDILVEYSAPVAVDNCLILGGTFTLVTGLPSGAPFPQGLTTNTYDYTDMSGNTGTCSFQVEILSPLTVSVDNVMHDAGSQNIGAIYVTPGGSQPGYTYEWFQNGVSIATTEDLVNIGMGLYTLVVTDAAGCKTEIGPIEVSNLSDTKNPEWADQVAIYPNPTSGRVFVVLSDELSKKAVDLVVYDAQGRLMLEQHGTQQKRLELDLSDLASGLYSILIRMEGGVAVKKIAVNR